MEFAEYDQYAMDIRAGGRPRASRGKETARSCTRRSPPHWPSSACTTPARPGFIVLDSPVVTYRDPISDPVGEDVDLTSNVVDHFYRNMLNFPGQGLILENGDPPPNVLSDAFVYRFTGTGPGRHGFFPSTPAGA